MEQPALGQAVRHARVERRATSRGSVPAPRRPRCDAPGSPPRGSCPSVARHGAAASEPSGWTARAAPATHHARGAARVRDRGRRARPGRRRWPGSRRGRRPRGDRARGVVGHVRTYSGSASVPSTSPWRTERIAAQTARSACGHSCTSSRRISIAWRSKRAMAPRAFTHSYRRTSPPDPTACEVAVDLPEDQFLVLGPVVDRLGDDASRHRGDAPAVPTVEGDPIVQQAVGTPLHERARTPSARAGSAAGSGSRRAAGRTPRRSRTGG